MVCAGVKRFLTEFIKRFPDSMSIIEYIVTHLCTLIDVHVGPRPVIVFSKTSFIVCK